MKTLEFNTENMEKIDTLILKLDTINQANYQNDEEIVSWENELMELLEKDSLLVPYRDNVPYEIYFQPNSKQKKNFLEKSKKN